MGWEKFQKPIAMRSLMGVWLFYTPGASPGKREETQMAKKLDTRLRAAYADLTTEPGAWVSLTRLRAHFPDVDRAALDDALRALARDDDVTLVPEDNQKVLTAADRAAAVRQGCQDKHLISIWAG